MSLVLLFLFGLIVSLVAMCGVARANQFARMKRVARRGGSLRHGGRLPGRGWDAR